MPSIELGCWFVAVGTGDALRVRIATGSRGRQLFPTEAEAERAEKEREQARAEALAKDNARLSASSPSFVPRVSVGRRSDRHVARAAARPRAVLREAGA